MGLSRHEMEQFATQKRIADALERIAESLALLVGSSPTSQQFDELIEHVEGVRVQMPTEKQIDEMIASLDVGLQ